MKLFLALVCLKNHNFPLLASHVNKREGSGEVERICHLSEMLSGAASGGTFLRTRMWGKVSDSQARFTLWSQGLAPESRSEFEGES